MARSRPGQPTKYRKDFHPADFIQRSRQGETIAEVLESWNICKQTFYTWARAHSEFLDALKTGRLYLEAYWTRVLKESIFDQVKLNGKRSNFNLGSFIWFSKNALKWVDKVELKTVDLSIPLSKLSNEELETVLEQPEEE